MPSSTQPSRLSFASIKCWSPATRIEAFSEKPWVEPIGVNKHWPFSIAIISAIRGSFAKVSSIAHRRPILAFGTLAVMMTLLMDVMTPKVWVILVLKTASLKSLNCRIIFVTASSGLSDTRGSALWGWGPSVVASVRLL